jgi:hemerythrin
MADSHWKDEYNTGISAIDDQHQHFFKLVGRLEDAIREGRSHTFLGDAIRELVSYTRAHLAYEESVFTEQHYSAAREHTAEHETFRAQIVSILKEVKSAKPVSAKDIITFMRHWLAHHILASDMKYVKEFQARGITLPGDDLISYLEKK